ncbi:Hypothetical Protein FCC1311_094602 [Hondaea fermentalgiana]|uniref:Uncharacterized protein n=1 Tax=Hondaea fermentalgiana TaxID=2315210 RepID=A0A2R5GQS5_9STRA|nr:Hypothetical Protein FCC1311_094602 [Hondaea fermentalgiana]|eukprot:GBG33236.1 Hypothetical Protein FCC1311_094602 [Hondaea fermentalgiana]
MDGEDFRESYATCKVEPEQDDDDDDDNNPSTKKESFNRDVYASRNKGGLMVDKSRPHGLTMRSRLRARTNTMYSHTFSRSLPTRFVLPNAAETMNERSLSNRSMLSDATEALGGSARSSFASQESALVPQGFKTNLRRNSLLDNGMCESSPRLLPRETRLRASLDSFEVAEASAPEELPNVKVELHADSTLATSLAFDGDFEPCDFVRLDSNVVAASDYNELESLCAPPAQELFVASAPIATDPFLGAPNFLEEPLAVTRSSSVGKRHLDGPAPFPPLETGLPFGESDTELGDENIETRNLNMQTNLDVLTSSSGQAGAAASGQAGAAASGQTGAVAAGRTGAAASGQTGAAASGQTGAVASGKAATTATLWILESVMKSMTTNVRGERDWEGARRRLETERGHNPQIMQDKRVGKGFKNSVKNLLHERRKRKQLEFWKTLQSKTDMRAALRDSIFKDTEKFPDDFVGPLAEYLHRQRVKPAPGSVLQWPLAAHRAFLDLALRQHRDVYGLRFHALHKDLFGTLLPPGEVEMAILSACDCESCRTAWALDECPNRATDAKALRLHWTRHKAGLLFEVLNAHMNLNGADMHAYLRENVPKLRGWKHDDIEDLLSQLHARNNCTVCRRSKRLCQRGGDPVARPFPEWEPRHRGSFSSEDDSK